MSKIKEKKKEEKNKNKMAGISNEAIDDFFEKVNDDDIKNNFIGVFSSNKINKFISYHSIIMNTDRSDRPGTHWWSFLDLHPNKQILLFDSFGFEGLKKFIIDNDKNYLIKYFLILINLKKLIVKSH